MLTPNSNIKNSFTDLVGPSHEYWLSDVQLEVASPTRMIFRATLHGPAGKPVWARAWLSTEAGTLAEAASPQYAYMRLESAPLNTEHVVRLKLV